MNTLEELRLEAKTRFYHHIISKLNATIQEYSNISVIGQYQGKFDVPEQVTYTLDGQINHLLAITVSLVNKAPESPYLEELFSNFLKDYMHLVNPELPFHAGELYLTSRLNVAVGQKPPVTEATILSYASLNQ